MKLRKYMMLLVMACLMMFAFVACGDHDDDDDTPSIVKGSIEEMAEALHEVKAGTSTFEITLAKKDEEGKLSNQKLAGKIVFDREANNYSLSLGFDGGSNSFVFNETELIRVVDNVLYFNLDAVGAVLKQFMLKAEGNAEAEKFVGDLTGWFAFPLPDEIEGKANAFGSKIPFIDLIEAVVEGVTPAGEKGDYTITLKTADDYGKVVSAVKKYSDANLKNVLKSMSASAGDVTKFDMNSYVKKIISTYNNDIREYLREHGEEYGITEKDYDNALKSVEGQDFNKLYEQYIAKSGGDQVSSLTDAQLDEVVGKVSKALDKAIGAMTGDAKVPDSTIRFFADDEGYVLDMKMIGDTRSGAGELGLVFRTNPSSASVKKPGNISGMKFILDILGPSYKRYIEKASMSKEIEAVSEIMMAAEKVACDPQYDLTDGTRFILSFGDGKVTMSIDGTTGKEADALRDWSAIALRNNNNTLEFQSTSLGMAQGTITGEVEMSGMVKWSYSSGNSAFDTFMDFSASFRYKWFE